MRLVLVLARPVPLGNTRIGVHALVQRYDEGDRFAYDVSELPARFLPGLAALEEFKHLVTVVVEVHVGRDTPVASTQEVDVHLEIDAMVEVAAGVLVACGITCAADWQTGGIRLRHLEEHIACYTVVILYVQVEPVEQACFHADGEFALVFPSQVRIAEADESQTHVAFLLAYLPGVCRRAVRRNGGVALCTVAGLEVQLVNPFHVLEEVLLLGLPQKTQRPEESVALVLSKA